MIVSANEKSVRITSAKRYKIFVSSDKVCTVMVLILMMLSTDIGHSFANDDCLANIMYLCYLCCLLQIADMVKLESVAIQFVAWHVCFEIDMMI